MVTDAEGRVEAYLEEMQERLRGMNHEDAREIVRELRSHILDTACGSGDMTPLTVEAALAALGSPEELAGQYLTDEMLARAEASRSPVPILRSLFHWARLSVAGSIALLGVVAGYLLSAALVLGALLKPVHPETAGLWVIPNGLDDIMISFRLGFEDAPISGKEVLGWWIVPLGLVLGFGVAVIATRFSICSVRRYRKSLALPRG